MDPLYIGMQAAVQVDVTVEDNFVIGAESEMEIMGNVSNICNGTWLVEDHLPKKPQVLIARAVVTPQQGIIPIRVLNLKPEPLTIYKGTKIAKAKLLENGIETVSIVNEDCNAEQKHRSLVEKLMENIPDDLSNSKSNKSMPCW